MGVRFECPNGHKLNVKAELAGKRGICPECGVRFIVPAFSGERVSAVEAAGARVQATDALPLQRGSEQPGSSANLSQAAEPAILPPSIPIAEPVATRPPMAQPAPAAESAAPMASSEPIVWYVRPAAGGQYGPATSETFQQWQAEGRVAADSWVWRTGWSDWRPGSEAHSAVAPPASTPPAASPPLASAPLPSAVQSPPLIAAPPVPSTDRVESHAESSLAEIRRAEIKRRKRRVQAISILLGVLALVMAAVLGIVLSR